MLAVFQNTGSEKLALFIHVLGAVVLFGGTTAVATVAWAGVRRPQHELLSRATFRTLLALVIPAWIVMRIGAGWIESAEDVDDDATWVGIGFIVAEPGLLLLLLATGFAFWWSRRPTGWQGWVVAALATIYVAALAVAWWAMATKP
jgi:hypothetical protein